MRAISSWRVCVMIGAISGSMAWAGEAPVQTYVDGTAVRHWLVVGALPNEVIPVELRTGPVDAAGLDRDYLGGEPAAVLDSDTVVQYIDDAGVTHTASASLCDTDNAGNLSFVPLYTQTDNKVAYAFCWIESDSDRQVWAMFGSDDRAMVWVNGERVHRFDARGRANTPGEDRFPINLKQGRNRVLVKVENGTGGWGFSMSLLGEEAYAVVRAEIEHRELIGRVQSVGVKLDGTDERIIAAGPLPELQWTDGELMASYYGELDVKTRWFDANLNEVTQAADGQWYVAYVEARTDSGAVIRRGMTVYTPSAQRKSAMDEMDYHVKLKAKVLGVEREKGFAELRPVANKPARVLQDGTLEEAGFKPGLDAALDELCTKWAAESDVPFTFMVVRHGVIAHHGAYGQVDGKAIDTDTMFEVASISKMLTGVMLAQFLDQELIHLDDPIGMYLPDFPIEGAKVMTVRQCMMHMAGLQGHGNWGGFSNPWFENSAANGLEIYIPGKKYEYDGLGLNLVGRAMEAMAGKSFIRLMNVNFYQPLGMKHTTMSDTSFGTQTTAHDLACAGQILLNGGSYGGYYFFSQQTQELIYPSRVGDYWPDSETPDVVYGMGNAWYVDPPTIGAPSDASKQQPEALGRNSLGHGSATNSVLHVDFANDLVITMARPTAGANYSEYMLGILKAIADHLAE